MCVVGHEKEILPEMAVYSKSLEIKGQHFISNCTLHTIHLQTDGYVKSACVKKKN